MSTDDSAWDSLVQWLSTFPGFICHVEQVDIPGTSCDCVILLGMKLHQPPTTDPTDKQALEKVSSRPRHAR
jgi:hypothetical protein